MIGLGGRGDSQRHSWWKASPATEESAALIPPKTGEDTMFFVRLRTVNTRFCFFISVETGYI